MVYYAQVTAIQVGGLTEQEEALIDYQKFGLFFSYDLLGYCFMALSTFFVGLAIEADKKSDKALKMLLLVQGVFAVSCFVMPMTGVFSSDMQGIEWIGTAVLEVWCVYFIPAGILSFLHFKNQTSA